MRAMRTYVAEVVDAVLTAVPVVVEPSVPRVDASIVGSGKGKGEEAGVGVRAAEKVATVADVVPHVEMKYFPQRDGE